MNELLARIKQLAQDYSLIRKEKLASFGNVQPTANQSKARILMKEMFAIVAQIQQLQKQHK